MYCELQTFSYMDYCWFITESLRTTGLIKFSLTTAWLFFVHECGSHERWNPLNSRNGWNYGEDRRGFLPLSLCTEPNLTEGPWTQTWRPSIVGRFCTSTRRSFCTLIRAHGLSDLFKKGREGEKTNFSQETCTSLMSSFWVQSSLFMSQPGKSLPWNYHEFTSVF